MLPKLTPMFGTKCLQIFKILKKYFGKTKIGICPTNNGRAKCMHMSVMRKKKGGHLDLGCSGNE